jgi:hypothetical protein
LEKETAMLKLLAAIAGVLIVAIAAVAIYAATLPNEFRIARTASIKAPADKIFPLISNLKRFNEWNPFAKQDPSIAITYNETLVGKGAGYAWDSDGRSSKGSLEITDAAAPSSVEMRLDMLKPMEGHNRIVFALRPAADATDVKTDVTWTMTGHYSYVAKVMGVVFNMDKMVGGEFEKGLADLRTLVEKA